MVDGFAFFEVCIARAFVGEERILQEHTGVGEPIVICQAVVIANTTLRFR